ncbi:hypothetical protein TPHSE_27440 [Terrisporobacter petrolearius]
MIMNKINMLTFVLHKTLYLSRGDKYGSENIRNRKTFKIIY